MDESIQAMSGQGKLPFHGACQVEALQTKRRHIIYVTCLFVPYMIYHAYYEHQTLISASLKFQLKTTYKGILKVINYLYLVGTKEGF